MTMDSRRRPVSPPAMATICEQEKGRKGTRWFTALKGPWRMVLWRQDDVRIPAASPLRRRCGVDPPRDHLAFAVGRRGGHLTPGQYASFGYDGIGNRVRALAQSGPVLATATYNPLNQLMARTNSDRIGLSAVALPDEEVVVLAPDGQGGTAYYPAHRQDLRWHAAIPTATTAAHWAELTVTYLHGCGAVRSETFGRLVPARTETQFDYDGSGNLTDDSLRTYEWDALDRLTAVEVRDSVVDLPDAVRLRVEFTYDHAGRRTSKKVLHWDPQQGQSGAFVADRHVRFVYAGWLLLAELDEDLQNPGTWRLWRSYVWGRDLSGGAGPAGSAAGGIAGLRAVRHHNLSTGAIEATYWPVYDQRGNVVALVDPDAAGGPAKVATFEYGPYGELILLDAADPSTGGLLLVDPSALCPFLHSTKYLDSETGLYYYGYRYYSPSLGRWLSRDPLAETAGLNLYAFRDPVNTWDGLGGEASVLSGWKEGDEVVIDPLGWKNSFGIGKYTLIHGKPFVKTYWNDKPIALKDVENWARTWPGARQRFFIWFAKRWHAGYAEEQVRLARQWELEERQEEAAAREFYGSDAYDIMSGNVEKTMAKVPVAGLPWKAGVLGESLAEGALANDPERKRLAYKEARAAILGIAQDVAVLYGGLRKPGGRSPCAKVKARGVTQPGTANRQVSIPARQQVIGGRSAGQVGARAAQAVSIRTARASTYNISTQGMSAAERAAVIKYARRTNAWLRSKGSAVVQSTKGTLRSQASAAARAERLRAARAGTPYAGQCGHVPDAAITGQAVPPSGWLDMTGISNSVAGGGLGPLVGQRIELLTVDGVIP